MLNATPKVFYTKYHMPSVFPIDSGYSRRCIKRNRLSS
nr:MAG TPA: hypothetical protein [Caudoviricetes sp.]DAS63969.1 MAG TPA: hypothetical protein [Caudoviricetes sp.]